VDGDASSAGPRSLRDGHAGKLFGMPDRAVGVVTTVLIALAVACGGNGGDGRPSKLPATDVKGRATRFAECARKSRFEVVVPKPPNERAEFLRQEGFEFAEVDLEEPPLLFFAAIVDFFPSRSDATRARDRIGASLFGPSPVRIKDVVVQYTDEPETSKRKRVENVVVGCLRE
jgi:CBS domain-containing protein